MLRLSLLTIFITFFCLYSFKDWYKSLCVLIAFLSIVEHPDVPKTIMGIQGLNPWNILFFFVLLGFMFRGREDREYDLTIPTNVKLFFGLYIGFCLIAYLRMTGDISRLAEWNEYAGEAAPTPLGLLSEHIINVIKWVVPGILLYYGCNSQKRFTLGILSALSIYFVLALLTIKAMPIGALADAERLDYLARKLLSQNVGYHRVNLAMMFAGGFWAIFSLREIATTSSQRLIIYFVCAIVLVALALSGGRTGYATWAAVGFVFAFLKWKRVLFYGPILALIVLMIIPAARDRFLMGFSSDTVDDRNTALIDEGLVDENSDVDLYTVTSGRTIAWPFVIDKIGEAPVFGYGKEAMIRTGLSSYLWLNFQEAFPHPHNMYLQWILDNGLIGFIPVFFFFFLILKYTYSLFNDHRNTLFVTLGSAGLALMLALFVAGIGSQTFYPREGSVAMWCLIGLILRVYLQRQKVIESGEQTSESDGIPNDTLWAVNQQPSHSEKQRINYYR